jgi:hypothetical protein
MAEDIPNLDIRIKADGPRVETPRERLIKEWDTLRSKCVVDSVAPYSRAAFWELVCSTVIYFLRRSE